MKEIENKIKGGVIIMGSLFEKMKRIASEEMKKSAEQEEFGGKTI